MLEIYSMEADYVVSKLFATNEMKYAFKLKAEVVKPRMKNLH